VGAVRDLLAAVWDSETFWPAFCILNSEELLSLLFLIESGSKMVPLLVVGAE
jgi:hypothetical protein